MHRQRSDLAVRLTASWDRERLYHSVFEHAVEGMFQTSPEGRYLRANPALARLYGYESPETLLEQVTDISTQLYVDPTRRQQFQELLQSQGLVIGFESEIYNKQGQRLWISENARAVRTPNGAVQYYEGSVVDITARKHAEAAVRQAYDDLEERVQERTAALAQTNTALQREIEERHRVEATLREQHKRFTSILDGLDEIVWSMPADLSAPPYFNPMTEKVYGRPVHEFIENPRLWLEVIHPEDRSLMDAFTAKVFTMGAYEQEYRIVRPDGDVRWLYQRARVIRNTNGQVLRIDSTATDLTAHKRAESQWREEESRYRQIVDNARDLIVCFNAEGVYTSVNQSHQEILGWAPEELIGRHYSTITTPSATAHIEERQRRIYAKEKVSDIYETEVRHKDGHIVPLEGRTRLLRNTKGEAIALMGIYRDITERKRTEAALQLRDRAMAATTEGITISDPSLPDHPLIYVNSGFERLTGYPKEEVLGRNCRFLQGPNTDPAAVEQIRAAIRDQQACVVEFVNYRKDGAPFWNRLSITPVYDEAGRVSHFIGVQSDVTHRKEVEQLKNDLVATVSHELRTPLTSLQGFAELLLTRDFPVSKQRQFLTIIQKETVRLTALINDFLDLQRIESGRQTYDFRPENLTLLIREVISTFSQGDTPHMLHVVTTEPTLTAVMDADRIRQVLTNLLSNAIKYSPHGGEITVGLRKEETEVILWVTDQGMGIPPEVMPKLFHKFFRVDREETRSINGTGLGLSLVKAIIEAHRGRVWVESQMGIGSTFFVTLPVTRTSGEADTARTSLTQDVATL